MTRTTHPAAPFVILIGAYRIAPHVDTADSVHIHMSLHRSPRAAARKLASVIAGRTKHARELRRLVPRDYSGTYQVMTGAGKKYALNGFRAEYC